MRNGTLWNSPWKDTRIPAHTFSAILSIRSSRYARNTVELFKVKSQPEERKWLRLLAKKLQTIASVSDQLHGVEQPAILIVEDDPQVRRPASDWLRRSGYKVLEATSGEEAVRAFAQQDGRISLLLTDVDLAEGMSGSALAESMQAFRKDLRVVLISGSPQNAPTFQRAWYFVPKPFGPTDLLTKVEAALSEEPDLRPQRDCGRMEQLLSNLYPRVHAEREQDLSAGESRAARR